MISVINDRKIYRIFKIDFKNHVIIYFIIVSVILFFWVGTLLIFVHFS